METKYYKQMPKSGYIMSSRRSLLAHLFKLLYILVEVLIVNLSLVAAFYIVYDRTMPLFQQSFSDYMSTMPLMTIAAVIYIDFFGMTHFFRKNRTDMIVVSFRFVFLVVITAAAIAFAFQWFTFPRWVMAVGSAIMLVVTIFWTVACLEISKRIYSKGRMLIVAKSKADADKIYIKIRHELKTLHINYLGFVKEADKAKVYRAIDKSTEVMISPSVKEETKSELFLYCANMDKTVYVIPQFADLIYTKFRVVQFHDMPTFMIDSLGLTFQQRLFKRFFDIVFSFIIIILTWPIQLLIALAVRLDSPGPILYSQERITESGRIYIVYKFRTMVQDAEENFGEYQSGPDDPRVTKVGRLLRNTHMDELPQFLNILFGDMSVVGPRSDRPSTIEAFESDIPGYNQRLKVKSGLTGLAQVYGKYNTDPEDKLRFDMMYIKNYSFVLDVRIILKTIQSVLPFGDNYNSDDPNIKNWEYDA
ncbi:MAG: sugar transferase [Clostridiales bacterium]|nr:sugar transferase [Clostridiales bacterium]